MGNESGQVMEEHDDVKILMVELVKQAVRNKENARTHSRKSSL